MNHCDFCGKDYERGLPHDITSCAEHLAQRVASFREVCEEVLLIECDRAHVGEEDPHVISLLEGVLK